MIRYEIEKSLIEGTLEPGDIPERWNDLYFKYLGIKPKDDKTGVLQDVHWSHGMFGYFPTYSLGSFYAAQFYLQAKKEIPGLEKSIKNGEFTSILSWLRIKVHIHGRHYNSEELCRLITGQKLDPAWFVSYIKEKYSGIYGIENWH
jgi:carboxypeptidase Taq